MEYDSGSLKNVVEEVKLDLTESRQEFIDRLMNKINEEKEELKEKVDREYENIVTEGKKQLSEEISDMIEKNKIKNKQKYLKIKKDIFIDFIDSLKGEFDKYRKKKSYINLVKNQAKKFRKKHKKIVVFCNKKDRKLFQRMSGITVKTDNEISLGIILENKNKTLRKNLTFDNLLRDKKKYITRRLFEGIE